MVDIAVTGMPRRAERHVPSIGSTLLFRAKVVAFRAVRLVRDAGRPLPRLRPVAAAFHPYLVAELVTPLWSDARPEEAAMQLGKVQNLRRAASALDGLGIPAEDIFSFWRAVGRASRRRGYVAGRMLQEGCLVGAVGGGLCQLSNALYDVALKAGATIVERHGHSRIVPGSAAMAGRDATVAWNYVDFRFRSPKPLRLEVRLTARTLVVRLWGADPAPVDAPATEIIELPRMIALTCATCSETSCHRKERPRAIAGRTAFLLDEATPEFRGLVAARRRSGDVLAIPLDGDRWGKPNYGWATADFSRVVTATGMTVWRGILARHEDKTPGRRVANALRRAEILAERLARVLAADVTDVVVSQSLLPYLWRAGHLGGRRVSVLMSRLPVRDLQARLDAAAGCHPEDGTLSDFRAPDWLVAAETAALGEAAEIVTPHTEIAGLFGERATLLAWHEPMPARRPRTAGAERRIAFPGPAIGRKGAAAVRDVARALDLEVLLIGNDLAPPGFWDGVAVKRVSQRSEWLSEVAAAVQPAVIEDKPRALLKALAAGLPVIASSACGLPPQPGLTVVPPDEPMVLATALLALLPPPGSLSAKPRRVITRIGSAETLDNFQSTFEAQTALKTETEEIMANLDFAGDRTSPETLLMLGIACSSSADPDRVSAHKWFNLAATRGNLEAARCRQELAMEMSPAEVFAAQRAAREWMRKH